MMKSPSKRKSFFLIFSSFFVLLSISIGYVYANKLFEINKADIQNVSNLVERAQENPLRVLGNDDCPLKITQISTREIPGEVFTQLTGIKTDLKTVTSVPKFSLINVSNKRIVKYAFMVRDPELRLTRGLLRTHSPLNPGQSDNIFRSTFLKNFSATPGQNPDTIGINSELYWTQFPDRSRIFAAIAEVTFDDGSVWRIREGGEVR